jgi:uncharacterized protein YjbI with pentapeptide repeats
MQRKIHQQLIRRQRFVVVAVLLGITLFILWARSRQIPLPVIIGSSSALGISALLVGGYYYKWAWTGFSDYAYPKAEGVEFYHRKTLWDWLQLLIIPAVLATAALLFNAQSTQTQLEIATDNQREAALQVYIDKMSELLLDGKLLSSAQGSELRSVARTRTLATLRQLDSTRKGQVLQFLYESQLISSTDAIIALEGSNFSEANFTGTDLTGTDLRGANLRGANLRGTDLYGVNLEGLNLEGVNLKGVNLKGVNLKGANLTGTNLKGANLTGANLEGADLRGVNLEGANLTGADLRGANLLGAYLLGAYLYGVNLYGTDLTGADLEGIHLEGANLTETDLYGANLYGANLEGANLEGANLLGAYLYGADLKDTIVTPEQLAQARSLTGATMPDGSIHD